MIQFNFVGDPHPTFEQQEQDKKNFIEKLGPFKEEFEQKGGTVTFDYSKPRDSNERIRYNLKDGELGDFTPRWNEYIRSLSQPQ